MGTEFKVVPPVPSTGYSLTSSTVPETDYAQWNSATAYTLGQRVIRLTTHKIYEALGSSTNKIPESSPNDWIEVSFTNRWRVFDNRSLTQTTNPSSMSYVLAVTPTINSVALINVSGISARVRVNDNLSALVYDTTKQLSASIPDANWYSYFFSDVESKIELLFDDLPAYGNCTLTVDIDAGSGTAACGVITFGFQRMFGLGAQYGTVVGIQDYSRRETNEFGEVTLVKRGFAKRASFPLAVYANEVDVMQRFFATIRATPVLFVGSSYYDSTIIFGWYKDFEVSISYPTISDCTLDVEAIV